MGALKRTCRLLRLPQSVPPAALQRPKTPFVASPIDVTVWDSVADHGSSFPNFTSLNHPDEIFDIEDTVTMFGAGRDVCVTGTTAADCVLTTEAAQFAAMVNTARAWGHCEGFSIVSANRYNEGLQPFSSELPESPEVLHALMRVASQFLPEVQEESDMGEAPSGQSAAPADRTRVRETQPFTRHLHPTSGHALLLFEVTCKGLTTPKYRCTTQTNQVCKASFTSTLRTTNGRTNTLTELNGPGRTATWI